MRRRNNKPPYPDEADRLMQRRKTRPHASHAHQPAGSKLRKKVKQHNDIYKR